MAKNILVISNLKELLASLAAIQPELAPRLRMVTASDMDEALAKITGESFDAIVLGIGHDEDDRVTKERHERLKKASPRSKIIRYSMRSLKTLTDVTYFFRQFSISIPGMPNQFSLEVVKMYDPDS